MSFLFVFSVLLVVVLADDPHGLKAVHEKCQSNPDTQVEESAFENYKKNISAIPPNLNRHMLCMAQGLNLVGSDGKINVDGVKTHVGHVIHGADKIDPIVKECAVDGATAEDTAEQVWKCLYKNQVVGKHNGDSSESNESGSSSEEHHHHHH